MATKTYFSRKLYDCMSEDLYLAGMGEQTHARSS